MVSSWELLMIWNSSNWRRNTLPECSCGEKIKKQNKCIIEEEHRYPTLWLTKHPRHYCVRLHVNQKINTIKIAASLTTRVRRHNVLAGARGSNAAWRSQTLILLQTGTRDNRVKYNIPYVWEHKELCVCAHDWPIISTADNPFVVKANAPHQLLVTFQDSQTCPALNVP